MPLVEEVTEKKELTELDKLKIDNWKLKGVIFNLNKQLSEANARLSSYQLLQELAQLEEQYGKEAFK